MLSNPRPSLFRRCLISAFGVSLFAGFAAADWDISFIDETDSRLVLTSDSDNNGVDALADGSNEEQDMACDFFGPGNTHFGCVLVVKQLGTNGGKRRNWLFMLENGQLVDRTTEYATQSIPGDQGFFTPTADRDVAIADVTGDGWKEVITATTLSGSSGKSISHPRVYLNLGDDGNGNWLGLEYDDVDRVPTMAAEPRFCSVSAGDVDNDGDMDLYLGDYEQGGSRAVDLNDRLWINDGNGYFTDESEARMSFTMRESSFAMATVIADVNNDGRMDILKDDALNQPQAVSISYNNLDGNGTTGWFDAYQLATPSIDPYHINTGDANGDGFLDIVVTRDAVDSVLINKGLDGQGQVIWENTFITDSEPNDFGGNNKFMDLDQDGFDDVFITSMDVDLVNPGDRGYLFHTTPCAGDFCVPSFENEGNVGISIAHYQGSNDVWNFDINGDTWDDLFLCSTSGGCAIYVNQPPLAVVFTFPNGQPDVINFDGSDSIQVDLLEVGSAVIQDLTMYVSVDDEPFQAIAMNNIGGLSFEGQFPASDCLDGLDYYFESSVEGGAVFRNPAVGEYSTFSALGNAITLEDNIEGSVSSWSVVNDGGLFAGAWEQAEPSLSIYQGSLAAPDTDANEEPGFLKAFVTEDCPSCLPTDANLSDVDGGPTDLISPVINLDNSDATIFYAAWFYTSAEPGQDVMTVWVTNNGSDWSLVETILGTGSQWADYSFAVSDFVAPSDSVQVRFRVADQGAPSVVEGGVDKFLVDQILCEALSCSDRGDCADVNNDGIRDDGCVWNDCSGGQCSPIAIVFGDMGGQFGACEPDGTADGNDRFLALNCFGNSAPDQTPGFPCESDSPNALNVDAGGPFGDCNPDGVCDGNDAFHALGAFEGSSACSCPLDGGPAPDFDTEPVITGSTAIDMVANRTRVMPNGLVEVDLFFDRALTNVRGYQLHLDITGGTRGSLELIDIAVDSEAKDFALRGADVWKAFNVETRQLVVGMDTQGVDTPRGGHLATLTFQASADAAGSFVVDLLHDEADRSHRTFLFGPHESKIELSEVTSATVTVGRPTKLESARR